MFTQTSPLLNINIKPRTAVVESVLSKTKSTKKELRNKESISYEYQVQVGQLH